MMKRILIVEDSPTQREKLRIILESEGFEVASANDGLEGLKAAGGSRFDLVLSDIMMPGLTGYEMCRKLKSEESTRGIPVILLTTLRDPMDVIEGLECGADNFITKPYEPEVLVQRVQNVLENYRLHADGKLKSDDEIYFLRKKFTVTSDKRQILNLLISTFEDTVRTNELLLKIQEELTQAKGKIEEYARQLEGKFQITEDKYKLLLEHAQDGILVLGPEGKVVEANWQAGRMFGLVRSEIEGADFFALLPKGQSEEAKAGFGRLVGEKTAFVQEYNLADTGQGFYVECSISLVEADGTSAVAIFRNMTERKNAELDLRRSAAELERSNGELKDLMLTASKNLKVSLQKIQTFSFMLLNDKSEGVKETMNDNLDPLAKLVEGMQTLVTHLSEVAGKGNLSGENKE